MTGGFLEEIVAATARSIASADYGTGLPEASAASRPSLRSAIERDRAAGALLVEYKRVSPGQTTPALPRRSVDGFLSACAPAHPSAYSCLAAVPRFEGSPADVLALARSTDRPVLFKDFIIDERQLDVASRTGASAVLLIARLESEGFLRKDIESLANAAHRRGLEVLLEFHAWTELSRFAGVPADVFGVNARNLDTLDFDRSAAARTLREALELGLRPLVGLSGVGSAEDAARFWEAGADGILVGTAVARSDDPARFLESLRRPKGGRVR